jgi:hypothetical protein
MRRAAGNPKCAEVSFDTIRLRRILPVDIPEISPAFDIKSRAPRAK